MPYSSNWPSRFRHPYYKSSKALPKETSTSRTLNTYIQVSMPVCLAVGCSNTSGKKWKWITQYCWSSGYTTWVAKIFPPVLSVLYSCHHINLMSRCLLHVLLIRSFSSRLQPALFYPLGCTTPGTLTS